MDTDKWIYTASYTWLADGTYVYGWSVVDEGWNTASISRIINIDTVNPAITFDQESWAAAHSHSVEITATDAWGKLVGNTATYSSGADGYTVADSGKTIETSVPANALFTDSNVTNNVAATTILKAICFKLILLLKIKTLL